MSSSYESGLLEIQTLNSKLLSANFDYEKEVALAISTCPSNLDAYDLIFSITIGILSAILDTNDKVADFFNEIHELASKDVVKSENPIKALLAKALHHQGDWMDKPPTTTLNKNGKPIKDYITRAAEQVDGVWNKNNVTPSGPHRIFWGHDIFSLKGDNPFSLCVKEYGVGRGVLQAIRHLIADICSRQGVPVPGSSYFDYIEVSQDALGNQKSNMKNKLLDFCQQYSKEVLDRKQGGFNNEIFNHMFSIHIQDVLSTGLVMAGLVAYCKGRRIEDESRKVQMRVIGYMSTAFGSALIGAATHNGIPYINWPAFFAIAKNVIQMIHITSKEIKEIIAETERLIVERAVLESKERNVRGELMSDLYGALSSETINAGRDDLINYLGEEQ